MTALLENRPERGNAILILAHGAGAPMDSDYMNALADALQGNGIHVIRFEFPYMAERRNGGGKKPPNPQKRLLDCWREVFRQVSDDVRPAGLPLLIGGKSMGGRMASLVADELGADGLCCFGFPFHPPGKPEKMRTGHFAALLTPTLILQGTRDPFGKPDAIRDTDWSGAVSLRWLEEGDHDFKTRKSSGRTQGELIDAAARQVAEFATRLRQGSSPE
ncbi:MAG: alpha/beta hydrolase [Porticoccaceae bacterium]|nr:alpha/beta hydrolase [Porticoccaceae bacterium]